MSEAAAVPHGKNKPYWFRVSHPLARARARLDVGPGAFQQFSCTNHISRSGGSNRVNSNENVTERGTFRGSSLK